ncbi:MAG: DUF3501 family protein [Acidobacteria bacterium]|nr:MAG: DUF3501 family protein [Acidobacteriota bacterium]
MEPLRREEIPSRETYEAQRPAFRRRILALKRKRRVLVGDHLSVHFENRETMRYQVLEMLRAEGTWNDERAVRDELEAYNPLIPGEGELSATLMFEYETPEERQEHLRALLGIERHVFLVIGDTAPLPAEFDRMQIGTDRISSVQYVKWRLDPARRERLRQEGTVVRIVVDHPHYSAQAVLSEETRREIASDPD